MCQTPESQKVTSKLHEVGCGNKSNKDVGKLQFPTSLFDFFAHHFYNETRQTIRSKGRFV